MGVKRYQVVYSSYSVISCVHHVRLQWKRMHVGL